MRITGFFILLSFLFTFTNVFGGDALEKADTLRRQKKYDEARQEYLKAATSFGNVELSNIALVRAAQCHMDKKDYAAFGSEAAALLAQIPQAAAGARAELELTSASLPFTQKKWKTSAAKFAEFAASHPGTIQAAQAMAMQGEALGKQKKYDEAREVFLKIPQICNDTTLSLEARHQATNLLFDAGKYLEFEKEANALMALNPSVSDRYVDQTKFALAKFPNTQGNPLESARRFESYMSENPKRFHFEHHIALMYLKAADQYLGKNDKVNSRKCMEKGKEYLQKERDLFDSRLSSGKIKDDDYHSRFEYLDTYRIENNYEQLLESSTKLITEFPKPSKNWAVGMFFRGIAKYKKASRDLTGAAEDFDAVLNSGVVDTDLGGHLPTQAAVWRIAVAGSQNDKAGLKIAIEELKKMPEGPLKKEGLTRYAKTIKDN